jgi:NADH-quinone oxidoreductase subunit F
LTGVKWRFARQAQGRPSMSSAMPTRGTPVLSWTARAGGRSPRRLEGMLIGAYAMGAEYGYIYVREEYPIAVEHLTLAMEQMKELGLLGENILGTGFRLQLSLKMGAGAFVCGEETALMASIEGKRGACPGPDPLSRRRRPGRQAHQHQQRGDVGQCSPDPSRTASPGTARWARKQSGGPRSSPWQAR